MKNPKSKAAATRARQEDPTPDDVLDEYDFTNARKNPYAARVSAGGMVVVIDADLTAVFPTSEAVNEALRMIAAAAARIHSSKSDKKQA